MRKPGLSDPANRLFALRVVAILAVLSAAGWFFLQRANTDFPIKSWLFWRYVGIEAWVAFWAVSCLAAGHALVVALTRHVLPLREHFVVSFATGVLAFFVLAQVTGLLGLLRLGFFVWGPLALLGLGARPAWRSIKRLSRHWRHARRSSLRPGVAAFWGTVAGLVGVALVWFCTLAPAGTNADSLWYHLALSEQYAHTGRIEAYREGWIPGAYPQLASVVYAWGFLIPGYKLFEQLVVANQIEFLCACIGWCSVPALVRSVLPRVRFGWSWAFVWLFPASVFFVPNAGADLVAAMWAGPMFLLAVRMWKALDLRFCVLFGLMAAGLMNTKLSAAPLLLFPLAATAIRAVWLFVVRLRSEGKESARRTAVAMGVLAGVVLLATAPHWLKNALFYGDPIYPIARKLLPARPWGPLAERLQQNFWAKGELFRPPFTAAGLRESIVAVFDFSFKPRHFGHPAMPWMYFGSLFTLSLPLLLLVRAPRRLWALYGSVLLAVFGWYWVHHQDRYLITLIPWMAAATACVFYLVWQVHLAARVGVVALAGVQLIWGADVYLAHARYNQTVSLITSAKAGTRADALNSMQKDYREIARQLPDDAVILVHDYHALLGLNRKTISDAIGWQGGIDYLQAPTDLGVYEKLRGLGATHLLWFSEQSQDWDSQGANFVFWGFVQRHTVNRKTVGEFTVVEMPRTPPKPTAEPQRVLVAICPGNYPTGVHPVTALNIAGLDRGKIQFPQPETAVCTDNESEIKAALGRVSFVLLNRKCHSKVAGLLGSQFTLVARRGNDEQWVRK